MKTVKEVSLLTGVSIRTLHHYDAIGLLKPAQVTEAGYRLYDVQALKRLQTILLFRQLQFPLKQIKEILDAPDFDPAEALDQQIKLLELQKEHLEELIAFAETLQKSGGNAMSFKAFDNSKLETYAAEAKARWGRTEAYKEYEEKTKGQTQEQQHLTGDGLMDIFRELSNTSMTIIMITHEPAIADCADKTYRILDGELYTGEPGGEIIGSET